MSDIFTKLLYQYIGIHNKGIDLELVFCNTRNLDY